MALATNSKKSSEPLSKSFFFRRIIQLLLIALILWAVLTSILYAYIARPIFTDIKVSELRSKADMIAKRAIESKNGFEDEFINNTITNSFDFFGGWTYLVNLETGHTTSSILPAEFKDTTEEVKKQVHALTVSLKEKPKQPLYNIIDQPNGKGELLYVIVSVIDPKTSQMIGSVVVIQKMAELNIAFRSMNLAVLLSALLGLVVMSIPAIFATRLIVYPLQKMRTVALAMSQGDFSRQADDTNEGELGELARAMNHLSSELSATIATLRFERTQLRQILDSVADGIIAVDTDCKVTLTNRMVWGVFGLDQDCLEEIDASDFIHDSRLERFFTETIATKKTLHHIISKDHRQILFLVSPIVDEDKLVNGAVGLFRDITESERLEQTRREYVANISHELRSPLTAMRGLLEPICDGLVPNQVDQARYHQILLNETKRLARLINDMLELSRLQSGTATLKLSPFNLHQAIEEATAQFEFQAIDKRINLVLDLNCHKTSNELAYGSSDRTIQILVILIDNAIKFTPEGGTIKVSCVCTADTYNVLVSDTGIGIESANIEHVFDRFFKEDKAHKEKGTGLGLAIAKEISSQVHYDLSVASVQGEGTTFTLKIAKINRDLAQDMTITDCVNEEDNEIKPIHS